MLRWVCYYLKEEGLYGNREPSHMPDKILEEYIVQHIDAAPGPMISFSWHGGEPTILGWAIFRRLWRCSIGIGPCVGRSETYPG